MKFTRTLVIAALLGSLTEVQAHRLNQLESEAESKHHHASAEVIAQVNADKKAAEAKAQQQLSASKAAADQQASAEAEKARTEA